MSKQDRADERLSKLIKENYEEVDMDTVCRQSILSSTRSRVSARAHAVDRRLYYAVGAAASVVLLLVLWMAFTPGMQDTQVVTQPHSSTVKNLPPAGGDNAVVVPAPDAGNRESADARRPGMTASNASKMRKGAVVSARVPGGETVQPGATAAPLPANTMTLAVLDVRNLVVDAHGKALKAGDHIAGISTIKTGKLGFVSLVTRLGTQIFLGADTELSIKSGGVAELRSGRVFCSNRLSEIKEIRTAAGKVQLLGTVLDTSIGKKDATSVTVVEGKARLSNAHGTAVVSARGRGIMMASAGPSISPAQNLLGEIGQYDGTDQSPVQPGRIVYLINRSEMPFYEVWAMNPDGSGKHRIKSSIGFTTLNNWVQISPWAIVSAHSACWSYPDFKTRTAGVGGGHPITSNQTWLLNAATGQSFSLDALREYQPLYETLSPDCRKVAFIGSLPVPGESRRDSGVWIYDLQTGDLRKVLNGAVKTQPGWFPDSRRIVMSAGIGYGKDYPLVIIDTKTAEVQELGYQGAGVCVSPDGKRIAYVSGWKSFGSWYGGVPTTGSIFVLELTPSGVPKRISPEHEGALLPRWSPDGTRVLYALENMKSSQKAPGEEPTLDGQDNTLFIAQSDGSSVKQIYKGDGYGLQIEWAPDGKNIFYRTSMFDRTDSKVLLVAADGSGVVRDLGGGVKDSVLTPEEAAQTASATDSVREAVFWYSVANVREFEAETAAAKAYFTTSARIFSSLPWQYPLANLNPADVAVYADTAQAKASRSSATILEDCCRLRMESYFGTILYYYHREKKEWPPDVQTAAQWALTAKLGVSWINFPKHPEWVRLMHLCPGTTHAGPVPFNYTPPTADTKDGDVIVTCPNHPRNKLVYYKGRLQAQSQR